MTDELTDLITRVERLEATVEILRLSADYCFGADHQNLELFSSVWAEDGVWQVRDDLAFSGLDEIRDGIKHQWTTMSRGFHWTSNPSIIIEKGGHSARARFDVQAQIELLDGTWLAMAGSYDDSYVRLSQGWRLARREARVHSQRPLDNRT